MHDVKDTKEKKLKKEWKYFAILCFFFKTLANTHSVSAQQCRMKKTESLDYQKPQETQGVKVIVIFVRFTGMLQIYYPSRTLPNVV